APGQAGHWPASGRRGVTAGSMNDLATVARLRESTVDPLAAERHRLDLAVASALANLTSHPGDWDEALGGAVAAIRDAYGHRHVSIWTLNGERLTPTAVAVAGDAGRPRLVDLPRGFGILGAALGSAFNGHGPNGREGVLLTDVR